MIRIICDTDDDDLQALETYKAVHRRFPDNVECLKFLVRPLSLTRNHDYTKIYKIFNTQVKLCSDMGLKEAGEFALELKKAERAKEVIIIIVTIKSSSSLSWNYHYHHNVISSNSDHQVAEQRAVSSRPGSRRSSSRFLKFSCFFLHFLQQQIFKSKFSCFCFCFLHYSLQSFTCKQGWVGSQPRSKVVQSSKTMMMLRMMATMTTTVLTMICSAPLGVPRADSPWRRRKRTSTNHRFSRESQIIMILSMIIMTIVIIFLIIMNLHTRAVGSSNSWVLIITITTTLMAIIIIIIITIIITI